ELDGEATSEAYAATKGAAAGPDTEGVQSDLRHLAELKQLAEAARAAGSAKEKQLLSLLTQCGVPDGKERVVVFSERIKTLERLSAVLCRELKLSADQVR